MSRAAREAHEGGDCGFSCWYCNQEEDRETPVTLTSDGIEIPAPLDTDVDEDEDDVPNPVDVPPVGDTHP